jgi:hypothetical protein
MSRSSDLMVEHCFQDPDIIDLVRRQWRASGLFSPADEYGNTLPLLEMPRRIGRHLISPYEAGVVLSGRRPQGCRTNRLLTPLVGRLLAEVQDEANLLVQIRIPLDLLEAHGHAILEPFLLAHFAVTVDIWERVVDLRLPDEEILQRTAKRARYEIRRGLREKPDMHLYHRVAVPESVLEGLWTAAIHTRDAGGSRLRHDRALYTETRSALIREGKAVLAMCEHGAHRTYLLALVSRALGYYWDGGWSGEQSAFANYYLQYRTMLFLKELGVRRYSLGYVFPGLLAPPGKMFNIAFFKEGFGDELRAVFTVSLARESFGARSARRLIRGPVGAVLRRVLPPGDR